MTKITLVACLTSLIFCSALMAQNSDFKTPFELDNNVSATYQEAIAYYKKLAEAYPKQLQLTEHGATDSGFPLHLAILSKDGDFEFSPLPQFSPEVVARIRPKSVMRRKSFDKGIEQPALF